MHAPVDRMARHAPPTTHKALANNIIGGFVALASLVFLSLSIFREALLFFYLRDQALDKELSHLCLFEEKK